MISFAITRCDRVSLRSRNTIAVAENSNRGHPRTIEIVVTQGTTFPDPAVIRTMAEEFQKVTNCDRQKAEYTAQVISYAGRHSQMIRLGFRQSRERSGPDLLKTLERQLRRFMATKRPQPSSLDISGPAEHYLTQALMKRGEWEVFSRWESRSEFTERADRVELVRCCAPAAKDALRDLHREERQPGRHKDHASHTLLFSVAGILRDCLGVIVSPNPGTQCRRLLATVSGHFGISAADILDAYVRSRTVEAALKSPPKFRGVTMAKRSQV